MTDRWLPIHYRDFYDVPRAFVLEYHGELLFFDCPFSDVLEDYGDRYLVFKIPEELRERIDTISWTDLGNRSERIGAVLVSAVEFDETKRKGVKADVFESMEAEVAGRQ